MNDYVIIVAGGKGLRMGGEIPKQFLPIGGKPVLMRTIERFYHSISGINIILVLPVDQQSYWCQLCKDYSFDIPHTVANGGATRFHSVSNGLALVPDDADGVVGVHDGVRPFVSAEVIRKAYEVARREETAIPVIPIVETVRQLQDEGRSKTVDRSSYRLVQTPQTFSVSLLKRAYGQTYNDFFTDDASVVEALGYEVSLVEGNKENIKITTPSDLKFAEWICQQR